MRDLRQDFLNFLSLVLYEGSIKEPLFAYNIIAVRQTENRRTVLNFAFVNETKNIMHVKFIEYKYTHAFKNCVCILFLTFKVLMP